MALPEDLPLGKPTAYPSRYDASVLCAIDRADQRRAIGIDGAPPFVGEDVWNAYELTWLGPTGLPRIGVLTLRVPCDSPAMVESKSLKLYLGSFAQTAFEREADVASVIERDVSGCVGTRIQASIGDGLPLEDFEGPSADACPIEITDYRPNPALLRADSPDGATRNALQTHLFRTICPATGQPDSGAISVAWQGRPLRPDSLLAYLVSYREEPCFHEQAVERIFKDVLAATEASELTMHGRFLRRGGIDINPFRSTHHPEARLMRLPCQ